MAPTKTDEGSVTLSKAQVDVIVAGLLAGTTFTTFKPNWTVVGRTAGIKAHRNGGRHFRDAIAKLGLELVGDKFSKIVVPAVNNDDDDDDDDDNEDDNKPTPKAAKGVVGKKRKSMRRASKADGDLKKMKMEKGDDDDDDNANAGGNAPIAV